MIKTAASVTDGPAVCLPNARTGNTLADQFDWNWPTKINRLLIQDLFHLDFVDKHANVVFISGTGLGTCSRSPATATSATPRWCYRSKDQVEV